ncbi:MAG: DNA repair protein RecN [Bacteroidota bacterium]
MLRTLRVRDYAIIDRLEVEFDSGLNIITGETGAGKSILLGALKLILGERASLEAIRTGAKKAIIEGVFDDAGSARMTALLDQHEIEAMGGGMLIVRREVTASHSRAFVNDTPATLGVLKNVAANLIDLHGQHEHQSLLDAETHGALLDDFGGLGGLVETYRKRYAEVQHLTRERDSLRKREAALAQQKELFAFQIEEIDRTAPQLGEQEELEAERRVLENAERLYEATSQLYTLLFESENSVYDQLVVARNELQDLARIDAGFDDTLDEVRTAEITIGEATQFLQDYNARIEFNPERLDEIRERLGELDYLKRKYGGTIESVLEHRAEIGETFALASDFAGALQRLDAKIDDARESLGRAAQRLTVKRHEVGERTQEMIQVELATLGMPHARFEVRIAQQPDADGWIVLPGGDERLRAFPDGADVVEFYISANPGEDPKPLVKVASGGEVSRVMLALKTILAKSDRLPIMVFDEIDTGISGTIARRVGETMRRLARYHQIIAITHLPQVASLGDLHFAVEKEIDADAEGAMRTRTSIRRLDDAERAEAVAKLLAGEDLSDAVLQSARELIEAGREE